MEPSYEVARAMLDAATTNEEVDEAIQLCARAFIREHIEVDAKIVHREYVLEDHASIQAAVLAELTEWAQIALIGKTAGDEALANLTAYFASRGMRPINLRISLDGTQILMDGFERIEDDNE